MEITVPTVLVQWAIYSWQNVNFLVHFKHVSKNKNSPETCAHFTSIVQVDLFHNCVTWLETMHADDLPWSMSTDFGVTAQAIFLLESRHFDSQTDTKTYT